MILKISGNRFKETKHNKNLNYKLHLKINRKTFCKPNSSFSRVVKRSSSIARIAREGPFIGQIWVLGRPLLYGRGVGVLCYWMGELIEHDRLKVCNWSGLRVSPG